MFAKKKVALVILIVFVLVLATTGNSFASLVTVNVTIPKASVISIPNSIDVTSKLESLKVHLESNSFWSLVVCEEETTANLDHHRITKVLESPQHNITLLFDDLEFAPHTRYVYTIL